MKKIAVITGTRAEYGLLKPVIDRIIRKKELELQLIVTGTHLLPEFGETYKEILADGYSICNKIEMLMSSDTSVGITKSMGVCLLGLAECLENGKPDMLVILGDRYEMLVAATAALIANIPIAHIGGGELTEGAYDDAIRHSITKMSYLHFTATEEYRRRVIQLGEHPERVFNVGALGVENIKKLSLWSKEKLENDLNFSFDEKLIMVTYHPVTLEGMSSEIQFRNLLQALDELKDFRVIFTKANADTDGRIINRMIEEYVASHSDRCIAFASLGQVRYLSTLQLCKAVVGNSSSGIIEAPSLHVPTINIGDRQKGRIVAKTVIHCGYTVYEIKNALNIALSQKFANKVHDCDNPYEGKNTSQIIVEKMIEALKNNIEIKKTFYDWDFTKNETIS